MTRRDDGEVTLLALGVAGIGPSPGVVGLATHVRAAMVQHNGYVVRDRRADGRNVLSGACSFRRINTDTRLAGAVETTTPLQNRLSAGVFSTRPSWWAITCTSSAGSQSYDDNALSDSVLVAHFNSDGLGSVAGGGPLAGEALVGAGGRVE